MTPEFEQQGQADQESMGRAQQESNCAEVLDRVYEFLDNELDTASCDTIRQHLADCEPCLEQYDVEQAVQALVARSCCAEPAPATLRDKVLARLASARQSAATD